MAKTMVPCYDRQRHTCIEVARVAGQVKFIPLDVGEGLQVQTTSADSFDQRYEPMVNYPIEKAAQLFLNYSQTIGASKEALDYLGQVVNVSKQELEMATTKKQAAAEKPAKKEAAPKAGRRATDPEVKAPKAKVVKPATKSAKATKPGEKKPSAAQMFQDLIMAGKLTDDQIFEKVQAEFGLDEKKRGYVKWYRNHLKKQGQNPPEAKVAK